MKTQKNKRKLSSDEKSEIGSIVINVVVLAIWVANLFAAIFKPETPNELAAIAIVMVILLFGEKLWDAIKRFRTARKKAIEAEKTSADKLIGQGLEVC